MPRGLNSCEFSYRNATNWRVPGLPQRLRALAPGGTAAGAAARSARRSRIVRRSGAGIRRVWSGLLMRHVRTNADASFSRARINAGAGRERNTESPFRKPARRIRRIPAAHSKHRHIRIAGRILRD